MNSTAHSKLPPSAASRWTACTASVSFIEANASLLPKDSSEYADEGTKAHAVAAAILKHTLGQDADDAEMQAHVDAYAKWVVSETRGMILMIEQRVPLFYRQEDTGTTDAAGRSDSRIFIGDLKYGAGVSVYAERNKQMAIYSESIIREWEVVEEYPDNFPVRLGIFQPRDRSNPEPVRLWDLTRGELRAFCAEIQQAVDQIDTGKVKFVADPEKQCRFCPAKALCPTYSAFGLSKIDESLSVEVVTAVQPPKLPDLMILSRERRNKLLLWAPAVKEWFKALEDQEEHELLGGADPLEFKLVEGKSNRTWSDPEAAGKLLGNHFGKDQLYPPSDLISPAAAEKLLKGVTTSTKFDNKLASLITKPAGKPTMVPVTDKRIALTFDPTKGFEKQPEESVV